MFISRYGNLSIGIVFFLLSIVYYILADRLPPSQVMAIGPAFVPKIVAGLTMGISLVLIVVSAKKIASRPASPQEQATSEYGRVALTGAAFFAYVLVFDRLGFAVSTFLYLCLQIPIMAPREKINVPVILFLATATAGLVYYFFKFHLNVMLPAGVLPW